MFQSIFGFLFVLGGYTCELRLNIIIFSGGFEFFVLNWCDSVIQSLIDFGNHIYFGTMLLTPRI